MPKNVKKPVENKCEPSAADAKTKSQIKRMKKKEKKKKKNLVVCTELLDFLPEVTWESFESFRDVELSTADFFEESVAVSEVLVLDGHDVPVERCTILGADDEKTLRQFLKGLNIPVGTKKPTEDRKVQEKVAKPVITIPEEIFEDFLQSEEINQTKEAIKQSHVVMKTSPKAKRKETSPVKYVTKMVEAPNKVLYSYTGMPILTPSLVTMEDLDDSIVVVHCGEDRGFEPMDVILEEGSELSDTASDKKRVSDVIETVKITEVEQETLDLPKIIIKEDITDEKQSNVEIVLVESESDETLSNSLSLTFEGLRFIEDESGSSHAADDYEADIESAVESRRDTVVMDSHSDEEAQNDSKTDRNSRQNSTSSCNSNCTAKYLPPYSRSESEIDDWNKGLWRSQEIEQEIRDIGKSVHVEQLKKTLERDINPILLSKLTVMEFCDDPTLHETTWNKVVENTKNSLKLKSFESKEVQTIVNPASLAVLAKDALLSMPNGLFLSRKIGLPLSCPTSPPSFRNFSRSFRRYSDTETCSELQYFKEMPSTRNSSIVEFCTDSLEEENRWYGMPTNEPRLLVGLSPSQVKEFSETQNHNVPTQKEAANLLDLHQKFIERRSYAEYGLAGRNLVFDSKKQLKYTPDHMLLKHDEKREKYVGELGTRHGSVVSAIKTAGNEETRAVAKPYVLAADQNATPYTQYECDLKLNGSCEGVRNRDMNHGSCRKLEDSSHPENKVGRIILDRFMNNGEQSEENHVVLNKNAPVEEAVVTGPLPSVSAIIKSFEKPENLTSITEKDLPTKNQETSFITENYVISKNRDIAVIQNENRRHSLTQDEIFKQDMYDEYMEKLAQRVERRQHNSIKICNQLNDVHEFKPHGIEEEFMSKVLERQRSKSTETQNSSKSGDESCSKRNSVVLSGEADLTSLPKHIQDFFNLEENSELERRTKKFKLDILSSDGLLKEIDDSLVSSRGFLVQKGAMIGPTFKANAPRPGIEPV